MIKVTNPMMSNQPFQTEKQTKIVPLSQNQTHQQSHQTKTTSMKQPWKRLKPKNNREAAAGTIATVAAARKASEDNSVKSEMDATTIAPIDNKAIETVTETTGVEKVESHKSTDTESPVTDPAIDKDRAVNSDITPATASPTADKAPEATTESVDVENTESHHPDIGETSVSDSQAGKDSATESKIDPKATPSSDNTNHWINSRNTHNGKRAKQPNRHLENNRDTSN